MYKRYLFVKCIYRDYVVVLKNKNGKLVSFGFDRVMLNYIDLFNINHVIVDNSFFCVVKSYDDNMYYKMFIILYLLNHLNINIDN